MKQEFELYALINEKKWTEFLKALEVGIHTFSFPSVADIRSCKSVAYNINSDKTGRSYFFNVNKDEKKMVVTVVAR